MDARDRTSFLLMELQRILPAITWQGCQPVVLKGAALAPALYPEPLQRRVMDMGLLMDHLSEEDWLYLLKESKRIRMGTALGTWLHVVKEILGKEPPVGIPDELTPGWVTRRTIQGLDVAGGLLDRTAETVDGYTWLLHLLITPDATKRLRELKKHLLPGEAMFMDSGHPADQMPGFGERLHFSLYRTKHLLISGLRAMRALVVGLID